MLDTGSVVAFVVIAVAALLIIIALAQSIKVVQQGYVGVVQRFGRYVAPVRPPGVTLIAPFIDRLVRVDMRETPRTGDRQEVITADNVAVAVNATIFSQVVDAQAALFAVSNYFVAIDQQARTTLRNAFGNVTLDQALSQRERINASMQEQMEQVTDKWGIRISRIEIVDITPPAQILQAMALQKQADQEKRARILQSEGQQMSAVNIADGNRQAQIKNAEGERQANILRAEGQRQALILEAEGRAQAISTVYGAIKTAAPDPTLVAILQLDTLAKFADSDNTTIVVPAESAALLGAAQALRSVIKDAPSFTAEVVTPSPADLIATGPSRSRAYHGPVMTAGPLLRAHADPLGDLPVAFDYDHLSLVPRVSSSLTHRADADPEVKVGPLRLRLPLLGAPMPDVCGPDMCSALARAGALGVLHRFQPVAEQVAEFEASHLGAPTSVACRDRCHRGLPRTVHRAVRRRLPDRLPGHRQRRPRAGGRRHRVDPNAG